MKINIISIYNRCAVFEIDNTSCYYCDVPFSVYLDDKLYGKYDKNIFTIFNLKPDTEYKLTVSYSEEVSDISFKTKYERAFLDVRKFGAKGDSKTNCTAFLQASLSSCPENATVYIPKGVYLTGPLFIPSNITLYLDKDAVLLGLTKREDYPILSGIINEGENEYHLGTWEGNPLDCYASLITAINSTNVVICGEGTIDANAQNADWWQNPKVKKGAWRPRTIFLKGCNNISVVGVTVCNSPSWTVHPCYSDNLDFINISVKNPDNSPNTDGIDPESCENVRILGCKISVGDDCIAIKSGKYYMSVYHEKPSNNLLIKNCLLERGHGAVVIGSEISSGVKNVNVKQCLMDNTDRGLRIKTRRGRGFKSVVNDIVYENVHMTDVYAPFVINMFYFCDPDGKTEYVYSKNPLPVDELTPKVGSLKIKDVICENAHQSAMFFYGLPEQPIQSVEMENVVVSFDKNAKAGKPAMMTGIESMAKKGIFAGNVSSLNLHNVTIEGYEGEKIITEGITNVKEV